MTTRFFNQDASESFQPRELVEAITEVGGYTRPIKAVQWNTKSDFYSIAITTDLDMTPEQAEALYFAWLASDYDDEVLP